MPPHPLAQLPRLPDPASVAVVIPARGAAEHLRDAVDSATTQLPTGAEVIIAAAREPGDETFAVARQIEAEHENIRVIPNPAGTTPTALNLGIAATDADVIVRLDAHAKLPPGYIDLAIELLRASGAVNVGGRQVPTADHGFARCVALAMTSPFGAGGARYRQGGKPGPVDTVYLGVFRRDALAIVGGFDERLVRNQDYELNIRLRQAGGTILFHPDLAVAYSPRTTVGSLARQYYSYGRWKRAVIQLHPDSLRLRQLAPPLLVVGLAVMTLAGYVVGRRSQRPALSLGPMSGYCTVVMAAGGLAAQEPKQAPGTAVAIATMHLAWGSGFLRGGIRLAEGTAAPTGATR